MIRFYHDPAAGTSAYHWQIDDVKIEESPEHDVVITDAGSWNWNAATAGSYDSLDYTIIPQSQLKALPLNIQIFNNGMNDETNVTAHFNVVNSSGTSVYSSNVNAGTVAPLDSVTIFTNPPFTPPSAIDTYKISYSVTADATDLYPADNADSSQVMVSADVYARDDNARDGSLGVLDDNDNPLAYTMGNMFHIQHDVTLYAIDIAIAAGAEAGSVITGEVRDASDLENGLMAVTDEYYVVSADTTANGGHNMIHLILTDPLQLSAGGDYFVGMKHLGGTTVRVCSSGESPERSSFFYGVSPSQDPTAKWYFITSTPMVRMNFNATVGIAENDVHNGAGLGQNFPNPANSTTLIPYSLETSAKVSLDVYDMTGKLVKSVTEGQRAAGTYRIQLDTQDLKAGVYAYTLTAGQARITKRMTVVR
ncbi:MAG: T9SS type A sorting domain-containing protein [Flavobacteriales bacterium]